MLLLGACFQPFYLIKIEISGLLSYYPTSYILRCSVNIFNTTFVMPFLYADISNYVILQQSMNALELEFILIRHVDFALNYAH